jgi:DNA-binding MarR family transcriptional regulator
MALPLDALLRYWQRLTWWTGIWPLFRHMATLGLSLPDIMVLHILVRRSLNVAEVAQSIALSQSAASRAV